MAQGDSINLKDIPQVSNKGLHPHKLMMWIAMASMFMVFAGLTSAFILHKGSGLWVNLVLPKAFWVSTIVILASSYTMHKAVKLFKDRDMLVYKKYIVATLVLGLLFIALQVLGFYQLVNNGILLDGPASAGYLYIIAGLHGAHVFAAIVALILVYIIAFRKRTKVYSATSHEVIATFWHYVDILWIYLFLFFLVNFNI
jgi:cytochrome c oxidase subunit III